MAHYYWDISDCDEIIERHKNDTMYFDDEITMLEMYNMFRFRFRFGYAETMVILASLIKAGAKFRVEDDE
mgnify:CR=1 FL=1